MAKTRLLSFMNGRSGSSRPAAGKGLDLEYFLSRLLSLTIYRKLFFQQELRGLEDKTVAQQSQDRQFASNRFQDRLNKHHERHLGDTSKTTKTGKSFRLKVRGKNEILLKLPFHKLSPTIFVLRPSRVGTQNFPVVPLSRAENFSCHARNISATRIFHWQRSLPGKKFYHHIIPKKIYL
jgi:hypothetical protein